jgi:hypothetical protein
MICQLPIALPFIRNEDGFVPGQAQESPNEHSALRLAEAMAKEPKHAGALAFKRSGDPNLGSFGEPTVLKTFGEVRNNLDEL